MKSMVFHGKQDIDIEYIFIKSKSPSNILVVSFPAPGGRMRGGEWGYILSLRQVKDINILFPKGTPEYSLSRMTYHNGKPVIEEAIYKLIQKCANESEVLV